MEHKRKWIVACLALLTSVAVSPAMAADEDVVAIFKIKGPMPEQPSPMAALLGDHGPPSMFDMLNKLRAARSDANLKAVVFEIQEAQLGFAQVQELRNQFKALKAAEKEVWVFAEELGRGTMLLGSEASRLYLLPSGQVDLTGMYSEAMYFKSLFDKVGLQADILHCGDYKSAGEPFYLTGPSKPAEEQTNRLIDSIFSQYIDNLATSRKLTPDRVKELIDQGIISAKEALDAKLVDKLAYREEFVKTIKKRYGAETKIVSDYGGKKAPELDLENPFAMFKLFGEIMKPKAESDKNAIAVVFVEGPIESGESEPSLFGGSSSAASGTVRKALAQATADKNVKALILRVDSPGGSAVASDVICEAANAFKKTGRPFIVSMGNVAGSGGYYVSCLADSIFAEPGTITGSIGVVGGKIVTKGLFDWAGITTHEYKRGQHADIMNTNRVFSEEERKVISAMMNRVYDEFKGKVTQGRGEKIKGELESLAGGRVYTGEQAIKIGLVDQLGGFADAVKYAASEADLTGDYDLRMFPKPKSLIDVLSEAFGGSEKEDQFISTHIASQGRMRLATLPEIATGLEMLRRIDPAKAQVMENFLIQVELLGQEGVLLLSPTATMVTR